MDWRLMHCVKRIFKKKMFFAEKNSLFYGGARARLRDGGTRARFKKMFKMSKQPRASNPKTKLRFYHCVYFKLF